MANKAPAGKRPTVDAEEVNLLRTAKNLLGLYVACRAARPEVPGRAGDRRADGFEGRDDAVSVCVQGHHRRARQGGSAHQTLIMGIAVPVVLVVAYALGNVVDAGFQQLRDVWFASVGQNAVRTLALQTFEHLHQIVAALPPVRAAPAGWSRVIERGTKGIETIVRFVDAQHRADAGRVRRGRARSSSPCSV